MSVADVSLIACIQDPCDNTNFHKNKRGNVRIDDKSNDENSDASQCFVCDVKVEGRRYALATCKTQNSRSRVIEKLGELVGERYVVVIAEDDVICRSCANLINNLDRLESEIKFAKSSVLRFLEKKYSLAEGELLRCSQAPRLGQPPQITRKIDRRCRKRSSPFSDDASCPNEKSKKTNFWMRCDKCHYTTQSDAFEARHRRQPPKKNVDCDKCGIQFPATQVSDHRCANDADDNNSLDMENPQGDARAIQTAPLETIDLVGAEEDMDEDAISVPTISIPSNIEIGSSPKDEQIQLINLTNTNALQFQNFLASDGIPRDGQPIFMRVLQQFGIGDDLEQSTLLPVVNSDLMTRTKENTAKQVMTLTEDGSLEMMTVDCWNEEKQTDRDSHTIL